LRDESGTSLFVQVDRIDPDDPSRDTLVFLLDQPIEPGPEDYSEPSAFICVERGEPVAQRQGEPSVEVDENGVKLINSQLQVWLSLQPSLPPVKNETIRHGNWYAGSATSVVFNGKEILDTFQGELHWIGHDPEKRCMQVDKILLWPPIGETMIDQEVSLFNKVYRPISHSNGPLRASITIAVPFNYEYLNLRTGKNDDLECELYRVISLYAGADYLVEELFVKGKPQGILNKKMLATEAINPYFMVRYYQHLSIGHNPKIYRVTDVPHWLAVGSEWPPNPGYGFGTDAYTSPVAYPHRDQQFSPDAPETEKRFSWFLFPCKSAQCLHLFMWGQPEGFDARTGIYWKELIHKPLKAAIYQEAEISQGVRDDIFVNA
jgi:hypothetical protein